MRRARKLLISLVWTGITRAPFPLSVALVERLSRTYARVALHLGCLPWPARVQRFPAQLETLFGEVLAPAARRAIAEDCFVFKCLNVADAARRLSVGSKLAARLEVRGQEHLEAALAANRGAVLVTAHFGLPAMVRPILDAGGARVVSATRTGRRDGALRLGGDLWTRTRALHRLRDELAQGHVCLLMVEGGVGSGVRVPFFRRELTVGLGAFALARLARCPVLPFFVVGLDRLRAFRVEIGAPLPDASSTGDDPLSVAARAFARLFATYVRRYPGQLYYYDEEG